jgi:hypothetical protein
MPRRSRFDSRTVSSLPLVIVAGLPNPIHEFARQHLESTCSPKPRVIALGAGVTDRVLYPSSYVVNLVAAVTDFASRLRDKEMAVQFQVRSFCCMFPPTIRRIYSPYLISQSFRSALANSRSMTDTGGSCVTTRRVLRSICLRPWNWGERTSAR